MCGDYEFVIVMQKAGPRSRGFSAPLRALPGRACSGSAGRAKATLLVAVFVSRITRPPRARAAGRAGAGRAGLSAEHLPRPLAGLRGFRRERMLPHGKPNRLPRYWRLRSTYRKISAKTGEAGAALGPRPSHGTLIYN